MTVTRKTISRRPLLCAVGTLLALAAAQEPGVLSRYSLDGRSLSQWRLPDRLNEISGLALNDEGRLFAVADEAAIVYELDYDAGRIRNSFAFGDPIVRGDFEGIATVGSTIYLLTSDGVLIAGTEGREGELQPYSRYETGLGQQCELEGLAEGAAGNRLLLACKTLRRGGGLDALTIFSFSVETHELVASEAIVLPVSDILRRLSSDRLNPSGIAVDPQSGHLLLVASRQRALIELRPDGSLVGVANLRPATRHRQPEGIELTRDGKLLVADEGGSHKARLGVYAMDTAGEASQP